MRWTRRIISSAARREKVSSRIWGVGPLGEEVGDPMGEGVGFARAGAGDHQQRAGVGIWAAAVQRGFALGGVEAGEVVGQGGRGEGRGQIAHAACS
jgi:hypothetical protein